MKPLAGITVLEFSEDHGSAFLGRTLADHGARVIRLVDSRPRPSQGNRVAAARPLALDVGKEERLVDLGADGADALAPLLASAGVVIVGGWSLPGVPAALQPSRLAAMSRRFVLATIFPFGATGPRANERASPLTLSAAAGLMSVTGRPDRPLRPWGQQEGSLAGMLAYTGVVAALDATMRGAVQGAWLDISAQEAGITAMEAGYASESYLHVTRLRWNGTNPLGYPYEIYPCADGHVLAAIGHDWSYFAETLGVPALADERFSSLPGRLANKELLDSLLVQGFWGRGRDELMAIGQAVRCPFGAVCTVHELPAVPHWVQRGTFRDVPGLGLLPASTIGSLFHAEERGSHGDAPHSGTARSGTPPDGPPPAAGVSMPPPHPRAVAAAHGGGGPLAGITVVDLTWSWAGPLATRILADLGAEVIRIEGIDRPDWTRFLFYADNDPGDRPWDRGGFFHDLNRNKKSVVLNLASERGRELLRALVDTADLLVESFAPRVKAGWGIEYGRLSARNPALVMVSLSGFGQNGPYRDYAALGPTIEAMSGIASLGGEPGGPPERVGVMYGDPISGCATAAAAMTALFERQLTGRGQYVDVAGTEAAMGLISEAFAHAAVTGEAPAKSVGDAGAMLSGCYLAREGRWVCLTCYDSAEVAALVRVLGLQNGGLQPEAVRTAILAMDAEDLVRKLQRADLAAARLLTTADLIADVHLAARGNQLVLDHPVVGPRLTVGSPFASSPHLRPTTRPASAPLYGQHTREVLESRLGISPPELDELRRALVVADRPSQQQFPGPSPLDLWQRLGLAQPSGPQA